MIAYVSDESGRNQIYVRGFMGKANAPAGSGKWQISKDGGSQPRWRADGKELLYAAADGRMMSAGVKATSPTFEVDDARPLFEAHYLSVGGIGSHRYDVTADGGRFLVIGPPEGDSIQPITVVTQWGAGLKK